MDRSCFMHWTTTAKDIRAVMTTEYHLEQNTKESQLKTVVQMCNIFFLNPRNISDVNGQSWL